MDPLSAGQRSAFMRNIRGKHTTPELIVRKLCRDLGYFGYRLHRKDLPGRPDIAWVGKKVAIFVNGCFWHYHNCGQGSRVPDSNSGFWAEKFQKNRARDAKNIKALRANGWRVAIIWECELANVESLSCKIKALLQRDAHNDLKSGLLK
ncbi:MAG: DNA mismatch endonuclease Vsr [Chlorobiaceae bacterium]|nr:DNA mismatch endonuclease Vsr [Chlorobiaceae bacterium]